MIKYKCGRQVPQNVIKALKYVSKVGVLTTSQWHQYFGKGCLRWKQKQLKKMENKKFLKKHTAVSEGRWVLGTVGQETIGGLKFRPVTPVAPQHFIHDEFIGETLLLLELKTFCHSWLTEKQLKTQESKAFMIRGKDREIKYPDAVFKVVLDGKERTIALEYERTGKTYGRYKSILWQYNGLSSLDMILYVVENDEIKKRIIRAMKHVGGLRLQTRLAFVDAQDWFKDPSLATIQIAGRSLKLADVCTPKTHI